jgi:hypothetical protein
MIEASVVILMIVFTWGAMAIAYTNGSAKLNAQWGARAATMYYASNDCKKQMPGSAGANQDGTAGQFNTTSGDSDADRKSDGAPIDGGSVSARSTFFFASGSATKTRSLARWTATKRSSSWAVCNETPYNGNLLGMLKYVADLFIDLLPPPVQSVFR